MKNVKTIIGTILVASLTSGLVGQSAQVKNLNAPYQGVLNLKFGFGSRTIWLSDTDGSGTPNSSVKYTYDSRGNLVMQETDIGYDGIINRVNKWTYDAQDHTTQYWQDDDNDGTADYRTQNTYNAKGKLSERTISFDGDKVWDRYIIYTYNKEDKVIQLIINDDLTTKPESITKYTYEKGLRVRRELFTDGAGITASTIETWQYTAAGLVSVRELDSDNDGNVNVKVNYTYDKLGREIRKVSDTDGNGFLDEIIEMSYTENSETTFTDDDANSSWDRIVKKEFNSENSMLYQEFDNNGNGTADRKYYYTYDESNNRIKTEYDLDADGVIDQNLTQTYDVNGNIIRSERDINMDSKPDKIETYESLNPVHCSSGFMLPTHHIEVHIPSKGFWSFSTENSSQLVNLKLSQKSFCSSDIASAQSTGSDYAELGSDLDTGTYYLTVEPAVNNILAVGEYALNIRLTATSNVNELAKKQFKLYPNPSKSQLNVLGVQGNMKAQVLNIQGEKLKTIQLTKTKSSIDISKLNKGVYFLVINHQYHRFVKI